MLTGNAVFDAIGTIMIGVLLLVIAFFIAVEVKALLIGQSVERWILEAMREFLEARPEVAEVYNLLSMQMGHDAMVAIKAKMAVTGSESGMIAAINRVERDFRAAFPMVTWLFFEPDVDDGQ